MLSFSGRKSEPLPNASSKIPPKPLKYKVLRIINGIESVAESQSKCGTIKGYHGLAVLAPLEQWAGKRQH